MIVLRVFCSFAGTISSLLDHLPFSFISLSPVNSWPSSRCSIDIILLEMPSLITPNMSVPSSYTFLWASLVAQMVKNLPTKRETWVRSLGQKDPLEKGKATPSSILAWETPWTEKPVGLQSMGPQRVGHSWVTNTFTFTLSYTILWSTVALSSHMFKKLKMRLLFGLHFDQCQTPPVDCKLLEFIFFLFSSSPLYLLYLAKSLCLVGVQEIVFWMSKLLKNEWLDEFVKIINKEAYKQVDKEGTESKRVSSFNEFKNSIKSFIREPKAVGIIYWIVYPSKFTYEALKLNII